MQFWFRYGGAFVFLLLHLQLLKPTSDRQSGVSVRLRSTHVRQTVLHFCGAQLCSYQIAGPSQLVNGYIAET